MSADFSSASIILTSSHLGLPLSTTHVASGSVIGSGMARTDTKVRWSVARRMLVAWLITLPAAGAVGAACFAIASGLAVGLVFGAGIPLIYALAIRSLESRRPGSTAVAVVLLSLCALLALAGVLVIVFGKQLFGI